MLAKMLKNFAKWEISEKSYFSLTKIQDNG